MAGLLAAGRPVRCGETLNSMCIKKIYDGIMMAHGLGLAQFPTGSKTGPKRMMTMTVDAIGEGAAGGGGMNIGLPTPPTNSSWQ